MNQKNYTFVCVFIQPMSFSKMTYWRKPFSKINHYFLGVVVIGLTGLLCSPFSNTPGYHVVSYILLFVTSVLATFMSIGPVLLISTLSALIWNFFFIPPSFTFHIDKAEDILMFGMFFIIALVNGVLTTKVRHQEKLVREREERTNALFELTGQLTKAGCIDEVLDVAITSIRKHFSLDVLFVLRDEHDKLIPSGRIQKYKSLTEQELDMAYDVFNNPESNTTKEDLVRSAHYTFFPLKGSKMVPGVLAAEGYRRADKGKETFWHTFLTQIANALEREFLDEMAQKARFLDESGRLYKTLFNSISHELRIPVATIMGASDALLNINNSAENKTALNHEIFTASLRLNRLIENLLNMSRLESGMISIHLDWYDLNDLINKVANDLKEELKLFQFNVLIPENMPPVRMDFGLMEQVLYNLIFNATQYTPPDTLIELSADYNEKELIIHIKDNGPGFPEQAINDIFNKFFRVQHGKAGGLGLGLSIVKGFVEAHKGSITVQNAESGGALFSVILPNEKSQIGNFQIEI